MQVSNIEIQIADQIAPEVLQSTDDVAITTLRFTELQYTSGGIGAVSW